MSPKICPQCGKEFVDLRHPDKTYCSAECWHQRTTDHQTKTCRLCGKIFLDKAYRHRIYCSYECGKIGRRKRTFSRCETCGKEFRQSKNGRRRFCSVGCNPKAPKNSKRNTPSDPAKHTMYTCQECHKIFEGWTYRNQKFCSKRCSGAYGARQPRPKARRPENHLDLICETCGKTYTVHKIYNTGKRHSRFCSVACRAEWTSFAKRGPGNPNWTGGENPSKYGPNWLSQARKARKRDKQLCQVCKTKPCRRLDVHHIIPIKDFNGDWENANKLENLITLCRVHHFQVEKGRIPCPTVLKQ